MSRPRASLRTPLTLTAALLIAPLAACSGGSGDGAGRVALIAPDQADTLTLPKADQLTAEFGPATIRVHPLSRWESAGTDTKSKPRAIVHVELLDALGRGITWPGVLIVSVGTSQQALDLRTLTENDAAYDRITRTYIATIDNADRAAVTVRFRAAPANSELRADGILREVGQ